MMWGARLVVCLVLVVAPAVGGCGAVAGEVERADVSLDPARPVDPSEAELHLLVTEQECASGQLATGRVRVMDLVETADTIVVTIGVARVLGGADCPSNPPTPFTVELDDPIGGRDITLSSVEPDPSR